VTVQKLGGFLREIGGRQLGQPRLPDGSRPMVWAIRNHDHWTAVSKDEGAIARCYRQPGKDPIE
jgi:hypothetical protein